MAAARLGLPPFTIADLLGEVRWDAGTAVGFVEGAGGLRSPLGVPVGLVAPQRRQHFLVQTHGVIAEPDRRREFVFHLQRLPHLVNVPAVGVVRDLEQRCANSIAGGNEHIFSPI